MKIARLFVVIGFSAIMGHFALAADVERKKDAPSEEAQEAASKLIKEVYAKELKDESQAERKKLASKLYQQASDEANDDATRFVLLKMAASIALEAGDLETAISSITSAGEQFDIDANPVIYKALSKAYIDAKRPEQYAVITNKLVVLADNCTKNESYALAEEIAEKAYQSARRARDRELKAKTKSLREAIEEAKEAYANAAEGKGILDRDPDDAKAHYQVGAYLCFFRNNWEEGLFHLSSCDHDSLKEAATLELTNPAESDQLLKLADMYYDIQEDIKGDSRIKTVLKSRACAFYQKAKPNLDGLLQTKANKRIGELCEASDGSQGKGKAEDPKEDNDDPIFYLSFDKKTKDKDGDSYVFENKGTSEEPLKYHGAEPVLTDGHKGDALVFNGANVYLSAKEEELPQGADPRTVSLWIKTQANSKVHNSQALCWGASQAQQLFSVGFVGQSVRLDTREKVGVYNKDVAINDGKWHSVQITFDGTNVTIYQDGELIAKDIARVNTQGDELVIGKRLDDVHPGGTFFFGLLDEIRVYDRCLSEKEIRKLCR